MKMTPHEVYRVRKQFFDDHAEKWLDTWYKNPETGRYDKHKAMATLSRILKPNGVFAVSHFDSSQEINEHHESYHAVMHDRLPDEAGMRQLFQEAGLHIELFVDEPGFYCILSRK